MSFLAGVQQGRRLNLRKCKLFGGNILLYPKSYLPKNIKRPSQKAILG